MSDLPTIDLATGEELTKLGELLGVQGVAGESDESYRKRLSDAADALAKNVGEDK